MYGNDKKLNSEQIINREKNNRESGMSLDYKVMDEIKGLPNKERRNTLTEVLKIYEISIDELPSIGLLNEINDSNINGIWEKIEKDLEKHILSRTHKNSI